MTTVKFEAGKTYIMTHVGDSNLTSVVAINRISASRKTAWIQLNWGEEFKIKIRSFNGVEYVNPTGNHSKCASASASAIFFKNQEDQDKDKEACQLMDKVRDLIWSTYGEIREGWQSFFKECSTVSKQLRAKNLARPRA